MCKCGCIYKGSRRTVNTSCDQCRLFAGCQWSRSPREDRDKGKRQGEGGADRPISGNIHTLAPRSHTTQHTTPAQYTDSHYLSPTHTFWRSYTHARTHAHTHTHTQTDVYKCITLAISHYHTTFPTGIPNAADKGTERQRNG